MFSCEFYEISENIFFTEHLRTTASLVWGLFFYNGMKETSEN